jgi:hypothetical protein
MQRSRGPAPPSRTWAVELQRGRCARHWVTGILAWKVGFSRARNLIHTSLLGDEDVVQRSLLQAIEPGSTSRRRRLTRRRPRPSPWSAGCFLQKLKHRDGVNRPAVMP